jgi:hypothetical protein
MTSTDARSPITAADVQLQFDADLLRVSACSAGSGVEDVAGFECRFNMPGLLNSVQLSYVAASDTTAGSETRDLMEEFTAGVVMSDVELAIVNFQACM